MAKYFKVSGEEGTLRGFKLHANLGGAFKYASVMFESVNMRHASDNQIINIRHAESMLMVTTACHVSHEEIRKCGLHEPLKGSSGCLETKGHGDELE